MHHAGEVMRKIFEFCTPETVTPDIKYLMKRYDYDDLLVVDNMRDLHLVGVVHSHDVSDEALKDEVHPFELRAKYFMDDAPPTVDRNATIEDCLKMMDEGHLSLLPVVDEQGKCCGVVKKNDLLKFGD